MMKVNSNVYRIVSTGVCPGGRGTWRRSLFEEVFEVATGHPPYPLPSGHLLRLHDCTTQRIATGAGKTAAVILAWL